MPDFPPRLGFLLVWCRCRRWCLLVCPVLMPDFLRHLGSLLVSLRGVRGLLGDALKLAAAIGVWGLAAGWEGLTPVRGFEVGEVGQLCRPPVPCSIPVLASTEVV